MRLNHLPVSQNVVDLSDPVEHLTHTLSTALIGWLAEPALALLVTAAAWWLMIRARDLWALYHRNRRFAS